MSDTYDAVYARWLNNPEKFWAEAAEAVHWHRKWDRVLDDSRPPFYRWFSGGFLRGTTKGLPTGSIIKFRLPSTIH